MSGDEIEKIAAKVDELQSRVREVEDERDRALALLHVALEGLERVLETLNRREGESSERGATG